MIKLIVLTHFLFCLFFVPIATAQSANSLLKEFVITMWCPPPANDSNYQTLKNEGFNLTNVAFVGDIPELSRNAIELLNIASRNGIKSMYYSPLIVPTSLDDSTKRIQLNNLIGSIKNHPALLAYQLVDEPHANSYLGWKKLIAYIKERDPNHFAYINLFPMYANPSFLSILAHSKMKKNTVNDYNNYLKLFVDEAKLELISYDHYHFFKENRDGKQYFQNLALIKAAADNANVPFINILQACTIEPNWRLPNEDELRMLAYTTMTYGARGISWFLYWGPKAYGGAYQDGIRMPISDHIARINLEIKALGPELMKLTSTHVYHTRPLPVGCNRIPNNCPVKVSGKNFVLGLFKENEVETAFMITNINYKSSSVANIRLKKGDVKLMEYSIDKCMWIEIQAEQNGGVFAVRLDAGGGKLFKFIE